MTKVHMHLVKLIENTQAFKLKAQVWNGLEWLWLPPMYNTPFSKLLSLNLSLQGSQVVNMGFQPLEAYFRYSNLLHQ